MGAPLPTLFVAHGAPVALDEAGWMRELADWGAALPRPRAILIVSGHWERRPVTVGATRPIPLIYDFYGFPERFYRLRYPAPGAPELAERLRGLLPGLVAAPDRGLDHGVYVPLLAMYPEADVPVLQLSLPSLEARELIALGRALAPLREEGVLIVGSGFLTHNLRAARGGVTPAWARDFDAWCKDVLARKDLDALAEYRTRAPGVREALPTHEHFAPVAIAAGAAADSSGPVTFPIEGFWLGAFTRRSVQFG